MPSLDFKPLTYGELSPERRPSLAQALVPVLGVVEFVEDGRAKRPRVRFDRLEISIPLRRESGREAAGSATDEQTGDESAPVSEETHSEV